jgi:hypothetical protein
LVAIEVDADTKYLFGSAMKRKGSAYQVLGEALEALVDGASQVRRGR